MGDGPGLTGDVEQARLALTCLDLTNLSDDCKPVDVVSLCVRADTPYGHVAAVCVWPHYVGLAAESLVGHPVRVATVVNYPDGDDDRATVVRQTEEAVADGADEIDLVLPFHRVKDDRAQAYEIVSATRAAAGKALLTVILQVDRLNNDLVEAATLVAMDGGADFIKATTSDIAVEAMMEVAPIILQDIDEHGGDIGFNPGGGIHTLPQARTFLDLAAEILGDDWATPRTFRFSGSGFLEELLSILDNAPQPDIGQSPAP